MGARNAPSTSTTSNDRNARLGVTAHDIATSVVHHCLQSSYHDGKAVPAVDLSRWGGTQVKNRQVRNGLPERPLPVCATADMTNTWQHLQALQDTVLCSIRVQGTGVEVAMPRSRCTVEYDEVNAKIVLVNRPTREGPPPSPAVPQQDL